MDVEKNKNLGRKLTILFIIVSFFLVFGIGYITGNVIGQKNNKEIVQKSENSEYQSIEEAVEVMTNMFYYGSTDEAYKQKLIEDAISGMVDGQKDIHTVYFTEEELSSFNSSLNSTYVGIGVSYSAVGDDALVIKVFLDSPAQKAGIIEGDLIVGVDGVSCSEIGKDKLQATIRGEEGTNVVLTIIRNNEEMDITVTRGVVSYTVDSQLKGNGIGYIEISSFSIGTETELENHLKYLKENNVSKLIIDLRDNGGGYMDILLDMAELFLDKDDIILTVVKKGDAKTTYKAKSNDKYSFDNIVILVNDNTASCSEVFALCLKENCNATLVGEVTYGKSVGQYIAMLSDGSAIKYTGFTWCSGQGVNISEGGIVPDYEVSLHEVLSMSYLTLEEGKQYQYDQVGDAIKEVQLMLDFLGYQIDRTDGYFDLSTQKALTQFQMDNNLDASGILDEKTVSSLNSAVVYGWTTNKEKYDTQLNKALELLK